MGTKSQLLIVFLFLFGVINAQDTSLYNKVEEGWQSYVNTVEMDQSALSQEENPSPSSLLIAGRNYALNVYSFSFFNVRYHQRGYENFPGRTYINGVPINSLESNNVQFGLFSGMSNVFKVEETSEQLAASDFTFGGLGNHFLLSTSPTNQKNKLRISYTYSNRNYQHRLAATYNSGFNKKGWNYLVSANTRYSKEGYYPGSYYNGFAALLSVDKKWRKNLLSFAVWFSDFETGRQSPAVKETFELTESNYYNPQWGYQNGKSRNSNVGRSFLPTGTIRYQAKFSEKTLLNSAVGITIGKVSNTNMEWYNAPDPRPDYYRYLPSYYKNDVAQYTQLLEDISNNKNLLQIDWDKLYQINQNQTDGRALYALGKRVAKMMEMNSASTLSVTVNPFLELNTGVELQISNQRNYKEMDDLLGAKYWTNINAFIERDNPSDISTIQNNLDQPNQKIVVGEKYGYDYIFSTQKFTEWFQANFKKRKWDAYAGIEFTARQLKRTGHVRNGLFPNSSLGKDPTLTNLNWNGKVGLTYKLDGRQYIYVNAALMQQPAMPNILYVSPATRSFRNDSTIVLQLKTIELGFVMNTPKYKMRMVGYFTSISRAGEFRYFYDDIHQSFASYRMTDISRKHYGVEMSFDWNFVSNWTYSLVSNISKSLYNNRPRLIVTSETNADVLLDERVYLKNYRIANTPQAIVHNRFGYRNGGKFLVLDINSFFDRWSGLNPIKRTTTALQDINPIIQNDVYVNTLKQEKLPNGHTLDLFGGYSILIKQHRKTYYYIDFLISGNNLLDNKKIVSYAFEQMRLDTKGYDLSKFPNKYSYAMGRNYSINVSFRF
ncbi:MAG: hypothetical protein DI598_10250 [Pseudopedobacter saltans]|uniref:TonB-dependent receptor n=1 Tax=Pseudopedobacter saltans TaxID=151895 RepID=A0A2W5F3N8_9SPHI|nr:MAG: hypothetical protein DI598_10250 [Pseudopedobacter saltans]